MTGRGFGRGLGSRVPATATVPAPQEPLSVTAGRGVFRSSQQIPRDSVAPTPAPASLQQDVSNLSLSHDKRFQNYKVTDRPSYRIPDNFRERFKTVTHFEKNTTEEGRPVNLTTNYFSMQERPAPHIYEVAYLLVTFNPFVGNARERKAIVGAMTCLQHHDFHYFYDGRGSLFLAADRLQLVLAGNSKVISESAKKRPNAKSGSVVQLTFVRNMGNPKELAEFDFATMHGVVNMIFGHILTDSKSTGNTNDKLIRINDGFYMPGAAKEITGLQSLKYSYKLFNWPGYKPLLMQCDGGMLLNLDLASKYGRSGTALQAIESIEPKSAFGTTDHCARATEAMKGLIVITQYNDQAYKIMEVTNQKGVKSTFTKKTYSASGEVAEETLSIADYLAKVYNGLKINAHNQPLLLCVRANGEKEQKPPKGKAPRDVWVPLVPELCLLTGLTDDLKTNLSNWNQILDSARKEPGVRAEIVRKFAVNLNENVAARDTLKKWALSLGVDLESVVGRELPLAELEIGKRRLGYDRADADWTRNLRSNALDDPKTTNRMIVVYPLQREKLAETLCSTLEEVGRPMGINFGQPLPIAVSGSSAAEFEKALKNDPNVKDAEMVLCMLPDSNKERYAGVKTFTSTTQGVPSQCILAKNVDAKSAKSIITKVALQMNAKMGGAVWHIRSPAVKGQGVMILGTASGRGVNFKGQKPVAFVATVNSQYNSFVSQVQVIPNGLVQKEVYVKMMREIITAYKKSNTGNPLETIILYRTMDFEKDMFEVTDNKNGELSHCLAALDEIAPKTKLLFCVTLKKCSSRFFADGPKAANPQPGTIVDNKVTVPGRNDFYLISHCGRKGTVMPTYYFSIYNTTDIRADDFKNFTFQMCHMYYNWSGTIKIPAVCQYAGKLSTMIAEFTHSAPKANLERKLWYL